MSSHKWTVSSLNRYLKLTLDNNTMLQNIVLIGEVSNFNAHHSGHFYFTVKDEQSRLSCVMFRSFAQNVDFKIENGMELLLEGDVSMFEAAGNVQLYVKKMTPYGIGDLAIRYEKLKIKLEKEGLFSNELKKDLPAYPERIALVTGKNTAAYKDLVSTLTRRWPIAQIEVYNALVQGDLAYQDIIKQLKRADQDQHDIIILARGGGSIEDLWAFNEEELARVLFELKTPIITGVGHETDFTIADFVADKRAPTPTGAAELSTPNIIEEKKKLLNFKQLLFSGIRKQRDFAQQEINYYQEKPVFLHPELLIAPQIQQLQMYDHILNRFKNDLNNKFKRYANNKNKFAFLLQNFINQQSKHIDQYRMILHNTMTNLLQKNKNEFKNQLDLLDSYSPLNTLKRGYSISSKGSKIIESVSDVQINDIIKVELVDGNLKTKIIHKEQNK